MERPDTGTVAGRETAAEADRLVRAASVALGLLVAQQVAAKATRDALFLSNFPVTMLPLISGLAAGLSLAGVFGFARGMARSQPPRMMRRALAANALLLATLWPLALAAPRLAAVAVYFQTAVFGATLVSGLWSVVNERFDPHTARLVVGRIGTGASVGAVVGGLFTWRAAALVGVPRMLLTMAVLTLACLLALGAVTRTAPVRAQENPASDTHALGLIRRQPLLRNVAWLVAVGALTEAVLDYLLSAAAAGRYSTGAGLITFFALYHSAVAVLILAFQTGAARRSLETLGLGGTLALQPAAIALGSALVALAPGFWPRVALRGLHGMLRNSLFRSAYELLFTPIPPEEKRPTKALIDVGADRLGTMVGSGVIALVLLMPAGASTRALLVLASALAAVTLVLSRRLQSGYVHALAESLRAGTVRLRPEEVLDHTTRAALAEASAAARRAAAEAAAATPGPAPARRDALLDAAADLRSADAARVLAVLGGASLPLELVRLVIQLLARDDLFTDAVGALRAVAPRCTGELLDVLLDPDEDPIVRRRVPRVLKVVPTQRAVDGLMAALQDERFDIRYRSAQALLRLQGDRSLAMPASDLFSAVRRELARARATPRGLEHVFVLLALALPGEPLSVALRAWRSGDPSLRGTALEYLENVLPGAVAVALRPWLGSPPAPSGRGLDEVRDDMLRSTASIRIERRTTARSRPRAGPRP